MRPPAGLDEAEGACGSGPPLSVSDPLPHLAGSPPLPGSISCLRCSLAKVGRAPASIGLASQVEGPPGHSPVNPESQWKEVEAGLSHGVEVSLKGSLDALSHQPVSF